jgi:hypothetical protein
MIKTARYIYLYTVHFISLAFKNIYMESRVFKKRFLFPNLIRGSKTTTGNAFIKKVTWVVLSVEMNLPESIGTSIPS